MLGTGAHRRSARVRVAAGGVAVVLLVAAGAACGSFSGDDTSTDAGVSGDASSPDVTVADAPAGADGSTPSDAANDVDAGFDSGAARHLSVFVLRMQWSISTMYDDGGTFAGRDSADLFCADEGAAAGLGSAFHAFMSRPIQDAIARLPIDADWSLPNANGPTDLVFPSRAAIDLGQLPLHMLNRGADGQLLGDDVTQVWTGTNVNGRATGDDCTDWGDFVTGTTGRTDSLSSSWTSASAAPCDMALHVFCFGY